MRSRKTTIGLTAFLLNGCVAGCAALNPRPPIEEFANKLADQAIIPAVKQGLAQGVEQLTIQAGAQGINPTYVVNFAGKWVVGIEGRASVGVEGIAGQLQVSSAGGENEPRAGAAANEPSPYSNNVPPDAPVATATRRGDPRTRTSSPPRRLQARRSRDPRASHRHHRMLRGRCHRLRRHDGAAVDVWPVCVGRTGRAGSTRP